jgi:hypothetical protein
MASLGLFNKLLMRLYAYTVYYSSYRNHVTVTVTETVTMTVTVTATVTVIMIVTFLLSIPGP